MIWKLVCWWEDRKRQQYVAEHIYNVKPRMFESSESLMRRVQSKLNEILVK